MYLTCGHFFEMRECIYHADMYLACGHLFLNVGKYSTCGLCFTCAHVVYGGHVIGICMCLFGVRRVFGMFSSIFIFTCQTIKH